MRWVQRHLLSLGSREVIPVWLQTPITYLRIVPFRSWALCISNCSHKESSSQSPPAFTQTTTAVPLCFGSSKTCCKAFPAGALREFDFQAHRIPELRSAPQIVLQLRPVLLHPTLLLAKPRAKFPPSLIVLSYSSQSLTEVNFLSPSINRNQQVKKFCPMWH